MMNKELSCGEFTELTAEESTVVNGGFIFGFVLNTIDGIYNGVTSIISARNPAKAEAAAKSYKTANSILGLINQTGRMFGLR